MTGTGVPPAAHSDATGTAPRAGSFRWISIAIELPPAELWGAQASAESAPTAPALSETDRRIIAAAVLATETLAPPDELALEPSDPHFYRIVVPGEALPPEPAAETSPPRARHRHDDSSPGADGAHRAASVDPSADYRNRRLDRLLGRV